MVCGVWRSGLGVGYGVWGRGGFGGCLCGGVEYSCIISYYIFGYSILIIFSSVIISTKRQIVKVPKYSS